MQKDLKLSLESYEFTAGPCDAPWKKQSQIVGGTAVMVKTNIKIFNEVIGTNGYVPLNHFSEDLNEFLALLIVTKEQKYGYS